MTKTQKRAVWITTLVVIMMCCITLGLVSTTTQTAHAVTGTPINVTYVWGQILELEVGKEYVITINNSGYANYLTVGESDLATLKNEYGITAPTAFDTFSGSAVLEYPVVLTGTAKKATMLLTNEEFRIPAGFSNAKTSGVGYQTVAATMLRFKITSTAPIYDNGFGKKDCAFDTYTKGVKDDTVGYTFNGWYKDDTELTDVASAVEKATYTAKWLNNGKALTYEPLNCIEMATTDKLATHGWKWDATKKILTLDSMAVEVPEESAILLPDGATVSTSGNNIVRSATANGWAFGIATGGEITFKGSGTLNVKAPIGICAMVDGGNTGINIESGNITAIGTDDTQGSGLMIISEDVEYEAVFNMTGGFLTAEGIYGIFFNANGGGVIEASITGGKITANGTTAALYSVNLDLTTALTIGEDATILTGTEFDNPGYIAPRAFVTVQRTNVADYNYDDDAARNLKIILHTCTFDKEVVDAKYLKTAATCDSAAVYYKSCECGEASETETFTSGEKLAHIDNDGDKKCDLCGTDMPSGLSVGAIIGIVIGIILFLLIVAYFCGYFFLYKKGKLEGKPISAIYKFMK